MSVVHLQTKSLSVSGRQRAEGAHAKKVYAARAYAEGTAYSRGAGSFINSIVAVKRCPRVVCPKAGQFGQVLVSAKLSSLVLHLCRPWRLLPLLCRWRAARQFTWDPQRRLSVLICHFDKEWHQAQEKCWHQKGSGTRKVLTPEKALAPEKCWHQKGSSATPLLTLHLYWCYHIC
jgi:hypothetical protein